MRFWVMARPVPLNANPLVIDSSALIALLLGEPEAPRFLEAMTEAPRLFISSFNWMETLVVAETKKGPEGARLMEQLLVELGIEVLPFDSSQAEVALDAWRRFGRGRHRAGLNLGDCAAYALSRTLNKALLFKGDDFPWTDVPRWE